MKELSRCEIARISNYVEDVISAKDENPGSNSQYE
jgi:hypothetical protein